MGHRAGVVIDGSAAARLKTKHMESIRMAREKGGLWVRRGSARNVRLVVSREYRNHGAKLAYDLTDWKDEKHAHDQIFGFFAFGHQRLSVRRHTGAENGSR